MNALHAGDLFAGRFEIEALAGRGGVGSVYRAHDRSRDVRVALKLLASSSEEDAAKFDREAELLASISHDAIVGCVDRGPRYLAMEWLDGITLAERLTHGRLGAKDALRLARRIADGLAAAHARGVVHRDLSPRNVVLVGGELDAAKIVDFGLAEERRETKTEAVSGIVGTPGYMAPEQARGEGAVDARADVFALGCILFECLVGRPPFVAAHPLAVLAKIVYEEAPRVDASDVPPALADLVARMLMKDPARRPADGTEVRALLDDLPIGTPTPAAPSIRERRLVAVVLARIETSARRDAARRAVHALRNAPETSALALDVLADGTIVGTYGARAATDLAQGAARGALGLLRGIDGARVALAIGRAELAGTMPTGEAIDRAASLLRRSEPGAVWIDDTTRELLDDRFDVKDGRLLAYTAARGGLLLGRETPFVGRARELDALLAMWDECKDEETTLSALVTAPAGTGKSRLRRELVRRVDGRVLIGRGDPLRAGSSFGLLAGVLRQSFGLTDDEPQARKKVEAAAPDRASAIFLSEILGLPGAPDDDVELNAARADPILMHDRMRAAFLAWLVRECREPCLLVLEDLQWGDEPSVRFVSEALERLRDRALFVVGLARPEVRDTVPIGWRGATEIRLAPLAPKAARDLVDRILAEHDEATREALVARAGGNAFYLEELIRAVAEGRGGELPATVLAMAESRLEALPAAERRLLRSASVLGRAFWPGALAAILGDADGIDERLAELGRRELIEPRARSTFQGERELVFRHDLVREAAYAGFTEENRAIAHAAAGRWLEAAGLADPLALAAHFDRGGVLDRARGYYRRAAEMAMSANDFRSVYDRAARAIELGAHGEERAELWILMAESSRWRGDHAQARTIASEAATVLTGGSTAWFRAASEALTASGRLGDYEDVERWSRVALGARAQPGAEIAQILCLCAVGRQLFHAGDYEQAARTLERVERVAPDPDALEPAIAAQVHGLRAASARHRGDLAGDLDGYQRVLAATERAGDARQACNARVSVAFAYMQLGGWETAEEELRRALDEANAMQLESIATRARQNLGLVVLQRGAYEEAARLEDRVIEESRAQGNLRFEGWTTIYRAQIALAAGDAAGALEFARKAGESLKPSPPARAGALAVGARALCALSRAPEALAAAEEAYETLIALGGIEEFESLVRLAHAEALHASADPRRDDAIRAARARIHERAAAIGNDHWRQSFLSRVSENARTLELATAWGGPS